MLNITTLPRSSYGAVEAVLGCVYKEELGWISSIEKVIDDRFSQHAHWVCVFDDDTPIGTLRIVSDSPEGLPVEQFADVRHLLVGRAVEVQRFAVVPAWRNRRDANAPYGIGIELFREAVEFCLRGQFDTMVGDVFVDTPTTPIPFLRRFRFEQHPIVFRDTELAEESDSSLMTGHIPSLVERCGRKGVGLDAYIVERIR
jgi:hypothetical protein